MESLPSDLVVRKLAFCWLKNKRELLTETRRFGEIQHAFSILSDDRSKASSKTIPPHSAI